MAVAAAVAAASAEIRPPEAARPRSAAARIALPTSPAVLTPVEATPTLAPAPTPPPTPAPAPPPTPPPCTPASLEERAGRVLIVGLPEVTAPDHPLVAEIHDIGVAGVLLTHTNVVDAAQVTGLVAALRDGSRAPLLVATDEEPGRVRTIDALSGYVPSARRLAAERTPEEVGALARVTGEQLAAIGVNINLAPVADLDGGPWDTVIGDRSFSPDPEAASAYALAYARGLAEAGVLPVAKHFPGHGRTATDSHVARPAVDAPLGELQESDLRPFRALVEAGVPVVMMANVAFTALEPDIPASLSAPAYRLLRELGFQGAAITDSIGMGAVNLEWNYGDAAIKAIAAGADGVLGTDGWGARWMRDSLVAAVNDGRLEEARLNQAAARMAALAGADPYALTCIHAVRPAIL